MVIAAFGVASGLLLSRLGARQINVGSAHAEATSANQRGCLDEEPASREATFVAGQHIIPLI